MGSRSRSRSPDRGALSDLDRNRVRNMKSDVYLPLSGNYKDRNSGLVVEERNRYARDNLKAPSVRQSRNRSHSPPAARLGSEYP